MTADQLRRKYLTFFKKRGHVIIPSASLVPSETVELVGTNRVLFTTAGMHPLIPYLLGQSHPAGKRLVSVQKCLRTDDIEEVGDNVHNTFFEMLGNWSLGDSVSPDGIGQSGYWKEETISWSWQFLAKELDLDKDRLYVSVFAGDKDAPFDQESYNIWLKLGIAKNHIFKYGKKENWWGPVGQNGPCGPDTEMFYDLMGGNLKNDTPTTNSARFVEVWNDVFMEYDKKSDGSFKPLEQKNVDTGMGLERILAVLNQLSSIYETDVFLPILKQIKNLSESFDNKAARVIADHLRAATFLISDGVLPSNTDRGYVLRRLIRRSIRYSRQLGIKEAFTTQIAQTIIDLYKDQYSDLEQNKRLITSCFWQEEERFKRTIEEGLKKVEKIFGRKTAIEDKKYQQIMRAGEKKELLRQLYKAKQAGINIGQLPRFGKLFKDVDFDKATISGKEAFDLYQTYGFPIEAIIELAQEKKLLIDIEGFREELNKHQKISKIAAAGKFAGGLASHSQPAVLGHTATHLLHQALRDVLGNHVYQTGSNINNERIRFDFFHDRGVTSEQLKKIEKIVNQKIVEDLKVTKELMTQDQADKLGAIGLFREKYGNKVSIYKIGQYSIEYCGGPHASSTGSLQSFKIIKEQSVGIGRRRIYAKITKQD